MAVTMILVTLLEQELRFRSRNFGSATLLPNEKRSHLIVVAAEEELDGGDHDLGDLAEAGRRDHVHSLLVTPHVLLK
jgi:hypothetical protein